MKLRSRSTHSSAPLSRFHGLPRLRVPNSTPDTSASLRTTIYVFFIAVFIIRSCGANGQPGEVSYRRSKGRNLKAMSKCCLKLLLEHSRSEEHTSELQSQFH